MQWWCSAQGIAWTWQWRWYPGVWLFLLTLAFACRALARRLNIDATGAAVARRWTAGGLFVLWVALDWPLGPLGAGYLASAHALQFLLIAMIATPMLLAGIRRGILEHPDVIPVALTRLTHPLLAGVVFNVVVVATHVPAIVDAAMVSPLGAFALDMAWLVSALLFWWPVIVNIPARPLFSTPMRLLYLTIGTLFHSGIAIVMLMREFPMYRIYELAPPFKVWSAIADQQLAGGIMELGGTGLIIGYVSVLFFRWARESH